MTDPAETPKIINVGEGFFVRQEIDNLTWIDLGDCVLVVDALEKPETKAEVFDAIESTMGDKAVRYLVNTHTHYDHVALNKAFHKRWGTEIVDYHCCSRDPAGRWFEGPARRVQMLHLPGCHTEEDCIVWAPEDKVLMVGDIFGWGLIPLTTNLRPEAARLLLDTHATLIDLGAETVVPGHGPLCTTETLQRWVEYFLWLCRESVRLIAEGKSDAEIDEHLAPPEDMTSWWRFRAWKHEDSVMKVVKAARRGWLDGV